MDLEIMSQTAGFGPQKYRATPPKTHFTRTVQHCSQTRPQGLHYSKQKTFLFTFFWLEGPKKSYKRLKFGCKKQKIQLFKIPYLQKIGAHFEERTVEHIILMFFRISRALWSLSLPSKSPQDSIFWIFGHPKKLIVRAIFASNWVFWLIYWNLRITGPWFLYQRNPLMLRNLLDTRTYHSDTFS